jgi:hypothetical protein
LNTSIQLLYFPKEVGHGCCDASEVIIFILSFSHCIDTALSYEDQRQEDIIEVDVFIKGEEKLFSLPFEFDFNTSELFYVAIGIFLENFDHCVQALFEHHLVIYLEMKIQRYQNFSS